LPVFPGVFEVSFTPEFTADARFWQQFWHTLFSVSRAVHLLNKSVATDFNGPCPPQIGMTSWPRRHRYPRLPPHLSLIDGIQEKVGSFPPSLPLLEPLVVGRSKDGGKGP
jgi:hypothetical protein